MTQRKEILDAILEAERILDQSEARKKIENGAGRVDVFDMIGNRDIPVMMRPLQGLLGAFIDDPADGVIVTTQRSLRIQRFTAAHELGHAVMHHTNSLDGKEILGRSAYSDGFDIKELQANIFASHLLTPQWLIAHHMRRQGWKRDDLQDPMTVYQLALRIGSSYTATCYALQDCKAITSGNCDKLLDVPVKKLKRQLVHPFEPHNWYGDVWLITERDDGLTLEGSRSDLVAFSLVEHSTSGFLWQFGDLVDAGMNIVADKHHENMPEDHVGGSAVRNVIAQSDFKTGTEARINLSEIRPWQPNAEHLNSLALDVGFCGPLRAGLLSMQREALLKSA